MPSPQIMVAWRHNPRLLEFFPALLTASEERRYTLLGDGIRANAWG